MTSSQILLSWTLSSHCLAYRLAGNLSFVLKCLKYLDTKIQVPSPLNSGEKVVESLIFSLQGTLVNTLELTNTFLETANSTVSLTISKTFYQSVQNVMVS